MNLVYELASNAIISTLGWQISCIYKLGGQCRRIASWQEDAIFFVPKPGSTYLEQSRGTGCALSTRPPSLRKARKQKIPMCRVGAAFNATEFLGCMLFGEKGRQKWVKSPVLSLLQNSSLLLLISETWAARHISEDERHALQMCCCSCKRCIIQKVTPLSHIVIFIQIAGAELCYFTLSKS